MTEVNEHAREAYEKLPPELQAEIDFMDEQWRELVERLDGDED